MTLPEALDRATVRWSPREGGAEVELRFRGDEFFFDGHFPDDPVLPAVVQVQAAAHFASRLLARPLRVREVTRAKFLSPAGPCDLLRLSLEVAPEQDRYRIKGLWTAGERRVAEFTLRAAGQEPAAQRSVTKA